MSQMLLQARKYAALGWSVIPIPLGAKAPVIKWDEFQQRHPTDEELNKWFGKDDSNLGIVTGKISNLSVLDADGDDGVKTLQELKITSPFTAFSGSGKHLYFKDAGLLNSIKKLGKGLDVRGEGGQVVGPPSIHSSGKRYQWATGTVPSLSVLPVWPSSLFSCATSACVPSVQPPTEPGLLKALAGVGQGERHATLVKLLTYWVPRNSYDVVKYMAIEWNKKNSPPYPEDEIVKQLNDIAGRYKKGQYTSNFRTPQEAVNEKPKEPIVLKTPRNGLDSYRERYATRGSFVAPELPSGFATLDEATWGFRRQHLYTVGARPGVGKTTYLVHAAATLCRAHKRVLYLSTEMSEHEIYDKFVASAGEVNATDLDRGTLSSSDLAKYSHFLTELETFDLHIFDGFSPTLRDVREAVDVVKPDLVIFDYIQHISTEGSRAYDELAKFVTGMKNIAMEYNCAIAIASQLSRAAVAEGAVPEVQHLKSCGSIEEEASVVLLMHDTQNKGDRPILFRVAKNKFGKCGDTTLLFESACTKFRDMGVKVS